MSSIDYDAVRRDCLVTAALESLGVRRIAVEPAGTRWACPQHYYGRRSRYLSVSRDGTHWHCWECCVGGSVIDLMLLFFPRLLLSQAAREACRLCGLPVPYLPHSPAARTPRRSPRSPRAG